jgi:cytochrome c5
MLISGVEIPKERRMKRRFELAAAALVAAGIVLPALAEDRSGETVVATVCANCHATGRDGAPRIGDSKAWEARSKRGLSSLTDSALQGVRKMPPHGGQLDVTDVEIKRAITFMVNKSGGHWVEPIDRRHPPAERSGESIVKAQCSKCHSTGANGAPKIGDKDAWIQRARLGFDSVVRSAINGHGAMPARGGMADLTDAEMRAAVTYMFQTSVKEGKAK